MGRKHRTLVSCALTCSTKRVSEMVEARRAAAKHSCRGAGVRGTAESVRQHVSVSMCEMRRFCYFSLALFDASREWAPSWVDFFLTWMASASPYPTALLKTLTTSRRPIAVRGVEVFGGWENLSAHLRASTLARRATEEKSYRESHTKKKPLCTPMVPTVTILCSSVSTDSQSLIY